ncbi:MAG: hypothetical protein WEC59_05595 [Salibacteraceae bacterium]
MKYVTRYSRPEAKVCQANTCVTVYDDTARVVGAILVFIVSAIAIGLFARAIR